MKPRTCWSFEFLSCVVALSSLAAKEQAPRPQSFLRTSNSDPDVRAQEKYFGYNDKHQEGSSAGRDDARAQRRDGESRAAIQRQRGGDDSPMSLSRSKRHAARDGSDRAASQRQGRDESPTSRSKSLATSRHQEGSRAGRDAARAQRREGGERAAIQRQRNTDDKTTSLPRPTHNDDGVHQSLELV